LITRKGIYLPLLVLALAGGAALFLLLRPAPSHGAPAPTITLRAVPANPGPLNSCISGTPTPCPPNASTQIMLYVTNRYSLVNQGVPLRSNVPNAFVVSSVDQTETVNGAPFQAATSTWTPPPNAIPSAWAGHWPSTVQCPSGPGSCAVAGSPAVLPGEKTVVFWSGWGHDTNDPDGKYVFTFTIHGTLNGTPMDLTASTRGIKMTR
jgi:hypothetical protein